MSNNEKCEAIICRLVELVNQGHNVQFFRDWGENTLTVYINDSHTHCGAPGGSFAQLRDSLHSSLSGGPGMSWVKDATEKK